MKLDGKNYCGGVADIAKFFDQVRSTMLYRIAEAAGMPPKVPRAYKAYLETLIYYNVLAGGMGKPHKRKCGIPQGCPLSMLLTALFMLGWLEWCSLHSTEGRVLADDIFVLCKDRGTI